MYGGIEVVGLDARTTEYDRRRSTGRGYGADGGPSADRLSVSVVRGLDRQSAAAPRLAGRPRGGGLADQPSIGRSVNGSDRGALPALRLFAKTGLVIKTGVKFELVVSNLTGNRVGIGWGDGPSTPSHRVEVNCPDVGGTGWLAYPGGYWLDHPACIPLSVRLGTRGSQLPSAWGRHARDNDRPRDPPIVSGVSQRPGRIEIVECAAGREPGVKRRVWVPLGDRAYIEALCRYADGFGWPQRSGGCRPVGPRPDLDDNRSLLWSTGQGHEGVRGPGGLRSFSCRHCRPVARLGRVCNRSVNSPVLGSDLAMCFVRL